MRDLSDLININEDSDKGISPVIGVILMVAITVTLAAVVGYFLVNIGGNVNQTGTADVETNVQSNGEVVVQLNQKSPGTQSVKILVDGSEEAEISSVGESTTVDPNGGSVSYVAVTDDGNENVIQGDVLEDENVPSGGPSTATPTATPAPTSSPTPTATATPTPTATATPSPTPSPTPTATATPTATPVPGYFEPLADGTDSTPEAGTVVQDFESGLGSWDSSTIEQEGTGFGSNAAVITPGNTESGSVSGVGSVHFRIREGQSSIYIEGETDSGNNIQIGIRTTSAAGTDSESYTIENFYQTSTDSASRDLQGQLETGKMYELRVQRISQGQYYVYIYNTDGTSVTRSRNSLEPTGVSSSSFDSWVVDSNRVGVTNGYVQIDQVAEE